MATVTSNVVQVSVIDEAGYVKSFNLDNPKEDLTLNQIKQAFSIPIAGRWWFGRTGSPIINIQSAQYTQTIKTQIEGETIEVTPANYQTTLGENATQTQDFTISGGNIQMYQLRPITEINYLITSYNATQKDDKITVSFTADGSQMMSQAIFDFELDILISGTIITIPIKIIRA